MKRFFAVFLSLSLFGCGGLDKGYDLYIYNSKGENAQQFEAMCRAYTEETGVRVKAFSIGSGQDHMETLRAEMNAKNKPAIFSIQGLKELVEWQEGGFVLDLSQVQDPPFAALVSGVAPSLRLTTGDASSYGIPYNVEGYGYIVDRRMLAAIFGTAAVEPVISDIKSASYDEWAALIRALDRWIRTPQAIRVVLSGRSYSLVPAHAGPALNLTGVFAVMGAEKWTYGDHFINVALNAVFSSPNEAFTAPDDKIRSARPAFTAYARALDLKTSYLAGKNGPAQRGQDFVSPANFGYDQTVQIFTEGKAVFFKQGNWINDNIKKIDADLVQRLEFLPVKMPFAASDIVRSDGMTVDKLNRSIPVFVPNYYAVNVLASETEKKLACDFLVWLNTSPRGQKFLVEDFAFIPYNADPAVTTVPNALGNSIIGYLQSGDIIGAPYHGAPASWSGDVVGLEIMQHYLIKTPWNEADYAAIADYAVDQWLKLK
ncbi:MAG: ABC transporter substrate-binding protein [Spirochaetaceae bacterium]|jgi:raffinose/stachyose/melibiose transport system substrate-binding protein|nr:ABC transporter substrate-binding protein [Spirochaetaceae bacterium]